MCILAGCRRCRSALVHVVVVFHSSFVIPSLSFTFLLTFVPFHSIRIGRCVALCNHFHTKSWAHIYQFFLCRSLSNSDHCISRALIYFSIRAHSCARSHLLDGRSCSAFFISLSLRVIPLIFNGCMYVKKFTLILNFKQNTENTTKESRRNKKKHEVVDSVFSRLLLLLSSLHLDFHFHFYFCSTASTHTQCIHVLFNLDCLHIPHISGCFLFFSVRARLWL